MRILLFLLPFLLFSCKKEHIDYSDKTINAKLVAVEGYDIVSYHEDNKAVQGSSLYSVPLGEVYYYFSSRKNQSLFEKSPEKYLPKYGGFCAIGIALYDGKYDIDPIDFLIDDGELYLFCPDQLENWKADQDNLREMADAKWLEMEAAKGNDKEPQ